jgi:hypothetical protein
MMDLDALLDALAAFDLDPEPVGEDRLMVAVSGQWRRSMPVLFDVEERHLRFRALLAGALDENHEQAYRYALQRNERAHDVRFALDGDGNILLVGRMPLEVVDQHVLDELLGEIVQTADETFNQLLGTGFEAYVEREKQWRRNTGVGDNPAFPSD